MIRRYFSYGSGILAALTTTGAAVADPGDLQSGYHSHMWGDGIGYGFMGFGMMFLFWALIIILIVLAVRWFLERDEGSKKSNDALQTLKNRLARGEIDVAEYEERRKALEG